MKNKTNMTWTILILLYVIFCGLTLAPQLSLLFFIGSYQVLRRNLFLKENYRTYIFLVIGISGLFFIPLLNNTKYINGGLLNVIGFGSLFYLTILYVFKKFMLTYEAKQDTTKLSFLDKFLIFLFVSVFCYFTFLGL